MIAQLAVSRRVAIEPKLTSVTLNLVNGVTTQFYQNAYGFPEDSISGLGHEDAGHGTATIWLYQQGETYTPYPDCWITRADTVTKWNVDHVQLSNDYMPGVAVWQCSCSRKI